MHTLIVVLASASCLLFGFAAATHLAARARLLLTEKLRSEKEKALKVSEEEMGSLKDEVKQLKASNEQSQEDSKKSDKLKKDLTKAKEGHAKELAELQEKLSAAEVISSGGDVTALQAALDKAGSGLNAILEALISDQDQKAALLSDSTGITIASAGDADTIDGVAAAASVLTSIPKQLHSMVPLDQHFSYHLVDDANAIVGHAFESGGELIALTTIGSGPPSKNSMKNALARLNSALE